MMALSITVTLAAVACGDTDGATTTTVPPPPTEPTIAAITNPPTLGDFDVQIAFDSERDGNAEVYVMNADGSEPTGSPTTPPSMLFQRGLRSVSP